MPAQAGIQYSVTSELSTSDAEYWIIRLADDDGDYAGELCKT